SITQGPWTIRSSKSERCSQSCATRRARKIETARRHAVLQSKSWQKALVQGKLYIERLKTYEDASTYTPCHHYCGSVFLFHHLPAEFFPAGDLDGTTASG